MSLLDRGNADVLVYLEEDYYDRDGNVRTRASKTPVKLRVWLSTLNQSGTAARRAEQDNEGYESEKVLRMRLRRKDEDLVIGAQSKVVYNDCVYAVFGDRIEYIGSPRTRHYDYTLRRS